MDGLRERAAQVAVVGGFGRKANYATAWRVILAKTKAILLVFRRPQTQFERSEN